MEWSLTFVVPFAPILLPFWIYLRYRFSKSPLKVRDEENRSGGITLSGKNQNEWIQFDAKDFIMAQAQANYVDVFLLSPEKEVKRHTLRTTLTGIADQMQESRQIHRSYLINLRYADRLYGNTRKGWVHLKYLDEKIPVSPRYFSSLKLSLQNRPKLSN